MILRQHVPALPLRNYVAFFWYYADWEGNHSLEHVLPDGTFQLVINLRGGPRKLLRRQGRAEESVFRHGWLSGTHSGYLVIDAIPGASMVGAHFKPGGIGPFIGSAAEFCDQVVELDQVWGSGGAVLCERLEEASGPSGKFRVLEEFLLARLRARTPESVMRKRVAFAAKRFCRNPELPLIKSVAQEMGMSHKHFIEQFRDHVGLTPKLFCRVRRFQQVLAQIHRQQAVRWTEIAYSCGYYDQSHFVHDFNEFAGLNPSSYVALDDEAYRNFVPVVPAVR